MNERFQFQGNVVQVIWKSCTRLLACSSRLSMPIICRTYIISILKDAHDPWFTPLTFTLELFADNASPNVQTCIVPGPLHIAFNARRQRCQVRLLSQLYKTKHLGPFTVWKIQFDETLELVARRLSESVRVQRFSNLPSLTANN